MALTLQQEQTVSSALHWIINQKALNDPLVLPSLSAITAVVDADILTQSGTVYSTPIFIGTLDNLGK